MSLKSERPIYTMGRAKGDFMLQRFCWKGEKQFTYQFTLALRRNDDFPQCDENKILDTKTQLAFLRKGRQLFGKVMIGRGYDLNTFKGWSMSGITQFTLRTIAHNADPDLVVKGDPSTIPYHFVSDFQHRFNNVPALRLIDDSDVRHVKWLGSYRDVSLVEITNARYVRKTIDEERTGTLKDWVNEFALLNQLQGCPYTVDLTISRNPYSPSGEDVVTAFLLEYGKRGTLKDFIDNVDEIALLGWMLQITKGIREMHLKPDNIIITECGQENHQI